MDENKKKDKKLSYLMLLLLFTALMLAISSYAWFTSNRLVAVEGLNVHIQAQGGIEISVDGSDWKTVVTGDDIAGARATYGGSINQLPANLEPVSTGGDVVSGFMNMYYGNAVNSAAGEYMLTATKSGETEGSGANSDGKYMAFDLFFKVDNASDMYLTPDSKVTYLGTTNAGVENAVRFAFLDEGTVSIASGAGSAQGLRGAATADAYIWEPNSDTHSGTGITNARELYNITLGTTGNAPVSYSGVINQISAAQGILLQNANSTNYPAFFRTVDVDYSTTSGFTTNKQVWNFPAGITKMRIYIWIEGQDVDCENGSSSGDLEFQFQLSTNPS